MAISKFSNFQIFKLNIPLPIAIALSVVVLCGWIPDFVACDYSSFATAFPLYLTFSLMLVNAYAVFFMMQATGVVRYRDLLPVFLYLITTTAFPAIHTRWQLQAAVVLTTILVQILHRAYREEDTARDCFLTTALALIASLFEPVAIVMVPLIWLSYILLRAMHLRTMLASLIAIALFLLYLALVIYMGGISCPYAHLFSLPDWQTLIGIPATTSLSTSSSLAASLAPASPAVSHPIVIALAVLYAAFVVFHYVLCIVATVRIDRDSSGQQSLLMLLYLFFLPTATAVFFFRQNQSLARGITFLLYILLLLSSYTLCYCA